MATMKWLRRNNKKILAFLVAFLAVMFLLPSFNTSGTGRSTEDQAIGTILGPSGEPEKITTMMVQRAYQDLQALKGFRLDLILYAMNQQPQGAGTMLTEDLGVQYWPAMMLKVLLLPETENRAAMRNQLLQEAQRFASDAADRVSLREDIDAMMGVEGSNPGKYFLLLTMEAEQAGFAATPEQVATVFNVRQMIKLPQTIADVCSTYQTTEENLRLAVGRYITILRYVQQVTEPLAISEPQLRKMIRDQWEVDNIDGAYVSFNSSLFRTQIAAPAEEQIQQQFAAYRDQDPGQTHEANPFGFGYRLPDRVQLECIRIDMQPLGKVLADRFNALPAAEREQQVQKFWQDNKMRFREKMADTNPPSEDQPQKPQYRDPSFDEVADKAKTLMLEQNAREKTEAWLNTARNRSIAVLGATAGKQGAAAERAKVAISYAEMSQKMQQSLVDELGTDGVKVTYVKTGYLSSDGVQQQFGQAGQPRKNQGAEPLRKILFDAEPFQAGQKAGHFEGPPVGLYDDIVPVFSLDYNGGYSAGYMIRIVATDVAREPMTLADDGSAGPTDQAASDPQNSALYRKVAEDVKAMAAFKLAEQQARLFAKDAAQNWDTVLAATNKSLRNDPNESAEAKGPLREESFASMRNQLEQFQQMDQKMLRQYYGQLVAPLVDTLKEGVDMANSPAPADSLPVLTRHQRRECLVFKDLKVTPPTEEDYQQRKPLVVQQLRDFNQSRLVITELNPNHIEKRLGYVASAPEKDMEKDSEESGK